ncbi:MAG: AAA family ATPase [Chloroflexota bacterium]
MSAPARLLGLRIQGFKSFAERTLVEFGPGVSAVVGPNGSGKSNLADALRWSLGEQGRSLRIRKSEDVIWAGSEKRSAQGMADVTLVLDNSDALLPVEYSIVELGRRLYRSGENDYLLNKQRVRLKDLQDLLDSANLAENAFLFIGQGMVDQALALRPEERRPLFEEVAGVRRHERRRRKAEEQLSEAESNLARVEDILAELRPQARRLGQLAEQQATRLTAGEELAAALIVAAHGRWHEAAGRESLAAARRDALRAESDNALEALETAESAVGEIAGSMAARAEMERERRAAHEAARAVLTQPGCARRELRARSRPRCGTASVHRRRAGHLQRRTSPRAAGSSRRRRPFRSRIRSSVSGLGEADRGSAMRSRAGVAAGRVRARGDELAALRRAEAARVRGRLRAGAEPTPSAGRRMSAPPKAAGASRARPPQRRSWPRRRGAFAAATAEEAAAVAAREEARGGGADAAEGTRRAACQGAGGGISRFGLADAWARGRR